MGIDKCATVKEANNGNERTTTMTTTDADILTVWGDLTVSLEIEGWRCTHPAAAVEVGRILRRIAERIEGGETYGNSFDNNGDPCGEWEVTLEQVTEDGERLSLV